MAILLKEEGIYDRCRIYATDMSVDSLRSAREGIFPLSSMQEYTNNWWQNVVAWSTAVIMVALTAALVWTSLPTGGAPPQP